MKFRDSLRIKSDFWHLFLEQRMLGAALFRLSLPLVLTSLLCCLREVHLSERALEIELEDMEQSVL